MGVIQSTILILKQNLTEKKKLLETYQSINGTTRTAILTQPPQEFSVKLLIPKETPTLNFSFGLNPEVFSPNRGDGVDYHIALLDNGNRFELFSKYIDPKNNPCDRKWFDEKVNLDQWAGKEVILNFSTGPGPADDSSWDWAYWGELRIETTAKSNQTIGKELVGQSYKPVYQGKNVLVYENPNVFSRAFVVYNVVNVSNFNDLLGMLTNQSVDLKQTAVVENLPIQLINQINQNSLQIQSVNADTKLVSSGELDVEVKTERPGLLVVTDQYYPGWVAIVDGKQEPIYAVDGIFRGVVLEEGDHRIQFKYRPLSFRIGVMISSLSLLILIIFSVFGSRLSRKHHE